MFALEWWVFEIFVFFPLISCYVWQTWYWEFSETSCPWPSHESNLGVWWPWLCGGGAAALLDTFVQTGRAIVNSERTFQNWESEHVEMRLSHCSELWAPAFNLEVTSMFSFLGMTSEDTGNGQRVMLRAGNSPFSPISQLQVLHKQCYVWFFQ